MLLELRLTAPASRWAVVAGPNLGQQTVDRRQLTEHRLQDTDCRTQIAGHRLQDTDGRTQFKGHSLKDTV